MVFFLGVAAIPPLKQNSSWSQDRGRLLLPSWNCFWFPTLDFFARAQEGDGQL